MSSATPDHNALATASPTPSAEQSTTAKSGPFAFLKRLSQSALTPASPSATTPQRKSSRDETVSTLSPNANAAERPVTVAAADKTPPTAVEYALTAWINAVTHVRIEHLHQLRDGGLLLKLTTTLFPVATVPDGADMTDLSRVNAVLSILRDQLHSTALLPLPEDVTRGDMSAVSSLLRNILRSHVTVALNQRDPNVSDSVAGATVNSATGKPFSEQLIDWTNSCATAVNRTVTSFRASEWSDGVVLCAVVNRLSRSSNTIDLATAVNQPPNANIAMAIRNGQRELSVTAPFTASELSSGSVSDDLIELYVSMLISSSDSTLVAGAVLQQSVIEQKTEVASDLVATHEDQFDRVAALHEDIEAKANSDEFEKPTRHHTKRSGADITNTAMMNTISASNSLVEPTKSTSQSSSSSSTSSVSSTVQSLTSSAAPAAKTVWPTKTATEDNAPQGGMEDMAVEAEAAAVDNTSSNDQQSEVESLRLALIAAQNENKRLLQLFDRSSNDMTADSESFITPSQRHLSTEMTALQRMPLKDQKELTQFINDLPTKRGWLLQQKSTQPPTYSKRHATLLLDCLYLADDELTPVQRAERVILTDYYPIQRGADSDSDRNKLPSSITGTKTGYAQVEEATVVGGRSLFFNDRGAFVLHLLPRDSTATHIVLTGANEKSTATADDMSEWVESINIRLCLLDLMQMPTAATILSSGGHEILTFLCDIQGNVLRIQNKPTDMVACFSYFKEGLLHRHVPYALTLSNIGMTDDAVKMLSEVLMVNRSVYHIDLSHNAITDIGASYIASALEMNNSIMSINLDGNRVQSSGLIDLFTVASASPSLQAISLQSNHIRGPNLQAAIAALTSPAASARKRKTVLKKLVLSRNDLGDSISSQIALVYSRTNVLEFGLSDVGISDTTIEALCSTMIAYPRPLHLLDFSYNKLTRASLAALSPALLACPSAVTVDFSGVESVDFSDGMSALLASGVALTFNKLRLQKVSDVKADNPSKIMRMTNPRMTITSPSSKGNETKGNSAAEKSASTNKASSSTESEEPPKAVRRLSITKEDVDAATSKELDLSSADELGTNVDQIAVDAAMDPNATTLAPSLPTIIEHDSGPVVVNADVTDSTHLAPPPTDVLRKIDTETPGAVTVRPNANGQ